MITPTGRGWGLSIAGIAALVAAYLLGQITLLVPAVALLTLLPLAALTLLPAWRERHVTVTTPEDTREGGTVWITADAGARFVGGRLRWRSRGSRRWSRWTELDQGKAELGVADLARGIHPLPGVRASVADRFGLWRLTVTSRAPGELPVGPARARLGTGGGSGFGEQLRVSLTGITDQVDQLVREHRREDGMRRVHWKQSAKRGRLMTRKEEPPTRGRATVVLDTCQDSHRGRDQLDDAVRTFAALVALLRSSGVEVRALETGAAQLPADAGALSEAALARALAAVDAVGLERVPEPGVHERMHVVTGSTPAPEVRALIAGLGRLDSVWGAESEASAASRAAHHPLLTWDDIDRSRP